MFTERAHSASHRIDQGDCPGSVKNSEPLSGRMPIEGGDLARRSIGPAIDPQRFTCARVMHGHRIVGATCRPANRRETRAVRREFQTHWPGRQRKMIQLRSVIDVHYPRGGVGGPDENTMSIRMERNAAK